MTTAERLAEFSMPEPNSGCLLWIGKESRRYGMLSMKLDGEWKSIGAHRAAWIVANGPIPRGMEVCHRCDTTHCINVDHLFLGTHQENVADMVAKRRNLMGERVKGARLTDAVVLEARHLHYKEAMTFTELSRRAGVSISVMSRAVRGISWPHLRSVGEQP